MGTERRWLVRPDLRIFQQKLGRADRCACRVGQHYRARRSRPRPANTLSSQTKPIRFPDSSAQRFRESRVGLDAHQQRGSTYCAVSLTMAPSWQPKASRLLLRRKSSRAIDVSKRHCPPGQEGVPSALKKYCAASSERSGRGGRSSSKESFW